MPNYDDEINDLLDRVEELEQGGGGGGTGSGITTFSSREEYEQAKASGMVKDGEIVGFPGVPTPPSTSGMSVFVENVKMEEYAPSVAINVVLEHHDGE